MRFFYVEFFTLPQLQFEFERMKEIIEYSAINAT